MCNIFKEVSDEETLDTLMYLDLKYFEPQIKSIIDESWFEIACSKTIKEYTLSFENTESDEDDGSEEKKIITFCDKDFKFQSFPSLSLCDRNSQIDQETIVKMQHYVSDLDKYHLEWYWLGNGCYYVNRYITLQLMTRLFPDVKWYLCVASYHTFVTNTSDVTQFNNLPSVIGKTCKIKNIVVADLTNYQIRMNLDYLSYMEGAKFLSLDELCKDC